MGGSGAEVARDAADIVMQTEELTAVAAAIEEGRAAHANVRRATGYLTATNLSEIAFVIGGMVGGLSQPLSAAQLLWINIVSDVLPAVGLSAEPPEAGTMRHPPYVTRQAILGGSDMPRLLTEAGIMAGGALLSTSWGALRFGAGAEARAMGFGSLLLGQLLHALNCRASGTGTNPAFAGTLGLAFAAQALAVAVPGLRRTLGIVPLGPSELAMTLAGALLPWLVNRMLRPDQSAAMAERTGETSGSPACSFASST
jgi:Ca2+-transporting ATPase